MRLITVLFVCLWSSGVLGWVSDISSPSAKPSSKLQVDVPLGSYVTVWGDWKEPRIIAGKGVEYEIYWIVGQRKQITPERTGYPKAAVMDIPFYLLTDTKVLSTIDPNNEKLFKADQVFGRAVRIRALALGDSKVKIDRDQVTIHVVEPPAQPDCAFGFYTDPGRYAYPKQWRKCLRLLAAYGLNVAIGQPVYPYDDPNAPARPVNATRYSKAQADKFIGQFLAKSLDTSVEEGLFRGVGGSSTLVYSMDPENVAHAFEYGKHVDRWPKLYFGNMDEPFLPQHFKKVREMADEWHRAGYLNGTSLEAASAFQVGDCLDLWIVQVKDFSETIKEYGKRCGAEVWVYSAAMRGTNAPMHRYLTGVWAWAMRPRGVMLWAFTHEAGSRIDPDGTWMVRGVNEHALATPDGPLPTVGLEGYRDGIVDYRILRDLERAILIRPRTMASPEAAVWLQQLREKADGGFWTNWDYHQPWDYIDTVRPPIESSNDVRRRALAFTKRIRAYSHHHKTGFAYRKLGRHHEAIGAFKQAVRANPDDADAHYLLGLSYLPVQGLGDKKSALAQYRILKDLDKDLAERLFKRIPK